jgi:DNA polymerase elongation subunit (family B)
MNLDIYVYEWCYENCFNSNRGYDEHTIIRIFGLTSQNETISVTIRDFLPSLYIEIPELDDFEWTDDNLKLVNETLHRKIFNNKLIQPIKHEILKKKKLYYAVKNEKKNYFIKYYFNTNDKFKTIKYKFNKPIFINGIDNLNLTLHETTISPILQFLSDRKLTMCGWFNLKNYHEIKHNDKETHCDYEYEISYIDISPSTSTLCTPNAVILCFDIEVNSSVHNQFPNAENDDDCIFQISCIISLSGNEKNRKNFLLTLGTPNQKIINEDEHIIIQLYNNEGDLIEGFIKLIHDWNPSVITGWNIFGFDIPYIIDRAAKHYLENEFQQTGMVKNKINKIHTQNWESSAFGAQNIKYVVMDGRIILDLLSYSRRELKAPNYKLNTIASMLLNAEKDPINATDIFESYRVGVLEDINSPNRDNDLLGLVGKYCVKDSILVQRLFEYLDTWISITEASRICDVSCSVLYTQGQQIRVFSQIYKYCYNNNIVVDIPPKKRNKTDPLCETCKKPAKYKFPQMEPTRCEKHLVDGMEPVEQYEGAIVLTPIPGLYKSVVPFDFKSLYPSLMISYNIDYSTYVTDKTIPDDLCHVIEWTTNNINYRYRFLKDTKGVVPTIAEKLLIARENTRQLMKNITDKNMRAILDKRQLNYKIAANSVYGILGAQFGMIPLLGAAMCVTALGRYHLQVAANHLQTRYNANLIYGDTDSNYVNFPHLDNVDDIWKYAEKIEKEMVEEKIFPGIMMLQFEKAIYSPFLILSKKRYVYYDLSKKSDDKMGYKGIILARRDNSKFICELYKNLINLIFKNNTKEYIYEYIIDTCNKCCSSCISKQEFVMTKSVGNIEKYKIRDLPKDEEKKQKRLKTLKCTEENYKSKALPSHLQLAEKMRNRGTQVDVGERIEYLVTTKGGITAKLFEKIEDPEYQQKWASIIKIDYLYYINLASNQIDEVLNIVFNSNNFMKNQYKLRITKVKLLEELVNFFHPVFDYSECNKCQLKFEI